ncbi:hypothetical protein DPQ25_12175 [Hydrogeniiclostridium mannosilyticum]|uniref:Glycosyltransferase RgtA/B/C/D-like domain-containing protein n=1 Tax=Hydrogeniiclostridium mannosilyticum TaxID=2764322 RepID=A0A328UAR2_9FIRM|nr:DUF6020 family protein [Hydrogeniiclostridium mannosilyticum]RAQ22710.1 hypothetical protein DPQ25_12175 [Hydrogeniiclostridium mannosilyticum]
MRMSIENKWIKKTILFLCALLGTIAVSADRTIELTSYDNFVEHMGANHVFSLIVLVALWLLLSKILFIPHTKRVQHFSVFSAALFALIAYFGFNIDRYSSLFAPHGINKYVIIDIFLLLSGYFLLFFPAIRWLMIKAQDYSYSSIGKERAWFTGNARSIFLVTVVISVLWLPYYFINFPGVVTWDSYYQINQGLGFVPLSDHQPFVHSLIQGLVLKIGIALFGTIDQAIALCSALQILSFALIFSFIIYWLARCGVSSRIRLLVLAFLALNPLIGWYSVTLWKDIWLAMFILLYGTALYIFCGEHTLCCKSRIHTTVLLLISILGVLFFKKTGIYIIVLTVPFLFYYGKKHRRRILLTVLAAFAVYGGIYTVCMNQLNIQKGDMREALSIPMQQIARTVKYHESDISEEDKLSINRFLPYDQLGELYNPKISDNVKSEFNTQAVKDDIGSFLTVYFKLMIQHPKTYLEAFLANSSGYWYPLTDYWMISTNSYQHMLSFYNENQWTIYDENYLSYQTNPSQSQLQLHAEHFVNQLRKIPIISLFFGIGCYTWLCLLLFFIGILKKNKSIRPLCVLIGAVLLTCLISPVYAEMRYAYPILLLTPILTVLLFRNQRNDHQERDIQNG